MKNKILKYVWTTLFVLAFIPTNAQVKKKFIEGIPSSLKSTKTSGIQEKIIAMPAEEEIAQNRIDKKNAFGISIPLISNYSNGVFYSLGNKKNPEGKAISYGINFDYSKKIYKNWFGIIGIGYFKQKFNIIRPFYFDGDTITKAGYSTKTYSYDCLTYKVGMGYSQIINKNLRINGSCSFILLNSFQQKYTPTGYSGYHHKTVQTNTQSLQIGKMVNLNLGVDYLLWKKMSFGGDFILPIIIHWYDDQIFWESGFGNDAQVIAENKFSIGFQLGTKYHF